MATQKDPQHRRAGAINAEGLIGKMTLGNMLVILTMIGGLFGVYSNNQSDITALKIQVQNLKDNASNDKSDLKASIGKLENKIDLLLADRRTIVNNSPPPTIIDRSTGK